MNSRHCAKIAVFLLLAVFTTTAIAGTEMTVNGTITDDYLLVDDTGEIYILTDSEKSEELLRNVGRRVTVTGDVLDSEDGPVIDVQGFKVLTE